jgi:hypothetical protein
MAWSVQRTARAWRSSARVRSGLPAKRLPQFLLVALHQGGFAAGVTVPGPQVTGAAALLQKLLDQAQRDPKAPGDFFAGAFLLIVGGQNPFTQIQGNSLSHDQTIAGLPINGYSFI